MSDKSLYINDLLARNSGYSFSEVTTNDIFTVTFKDGSSVTQAEATGLTLIDAYRKIRFDVLDGEIPAFISTTTQRDALSGVDTGTTIFNTTASEDQVYTGSSWMSAGGEHGSIVHTAASTITTTDNTQTVLATVTLTEGKAYLFTAEILGCTTDLVTVLGSIIEVTVKRVSGGSAALVGSISTTHEGKDSGASSWGATFTVSGNDLRVSVTGGNSTTVDWDVDLDYLEF